MWTTRDLQEAAAAGELVDDFAEDFAESEEDDEDAEDDEEDDVDAVDDDVDDADEAAGAFEAERLSVR
ncbi:hypothetical protein ADL03_02445 [Nocardia sp. NRRL S-836]|nr:hypothetical protein ADL03_02445 [Nocardia sp. NRRL S-836]